MKKRILALTLTGCLLAGLCACQQSPSAESPTGDPAPATLTYADTVAWDGQYDVVVLGMGFAGTTAAI